MELRAVGSLCPVLLMAVCWARFVPQPRPLTATEELRSNNFSSFSFLLVLVGLLDSGREKSGSSAEHLDIETPSGFALVGHANHKKRELPKYRAISESLPISVGWRLMLCLNPVELRAEKTTLKKFLANGGVVGWIAKQVDRISERICCTLELLI